MLVMAVSDIKSGVLCFYLIEEIKNGLDKEFIPLEPTITGLRFIEKK